MSRRSTTLTEDAERLRRDLPEATVAPMEAAARLFQVAARLGLEATTLPLLPLPQSVRDTVARSLRAGVATSALLPHVLVRAATETADRLAKDSGRDDE
jgi:hypothetical protein